MIGKGWPRPCLVVTTSWTNLRGTLVHCFLYGRGYDRDYFRGCPYFGRSKEHKEIFFFFLVVVEVLGVLLPILIALWQRGTHHGHMSYSDWLKGLIYDETFSDFLHFSRLTF